LSSAGHVLSVRNLSVTYRTHTREIPALHNVSLDIEPSEVIAIVGESGSGKSTLGLSIMNLLSRPPANFEGGEILYGDQDLLQLDEGAMAKLRGTSISMIFQEPMSSLDPVYRVSGQLSEAIEVRDRRISDSAIHAPHTGLTHTDLESPGLTSRLVGSIPGRRNSLGRGKSKYTEEMIDVLRKVQIPDPDLVLSKYPHQLSGGMAQRVMIAQALLERPSLLIADEPTSALDVTTQAQVLVLMKKLREEIHTSILFITHDLAVAAQVADRVVVMYAGEIVEDSALTELFEKPLHPYTEGLINSFPRLYKKQGNLESISGDVPDLRNIPPGCPFHPRCKYAFQNCLVNHPALLEVSPNRKVSCFLRS
jgi:peptide/nickel transport system ATP-binding protein